MAGVQIGSLYFQVTANTAPAVGSINSLASAASSAGSLISSALTTAFDAALYAAKTATVLIVQDVIGMGAAFNIAGQQAVGLFTSLTGSAEEAHQILAEFSQLSLDQPIFDPSSLQKTTSLLLTFQVAKDEALELAKNINLAAVALGRGQMGATQLARAIGQIQGRGWLEGDEARQLSEVGVNAYAIMAEQMGITIAKAQELGRQHMLLAEDVIPALNAHLNETFGPVAQNMLNTYAVQAQGVKNTITGIGSALVEPFIGRTGGGALVDFLSNVREELMGVIDVTEDGTYVLTGALAPLNDVAQSLADSFAEIGAEFLDFIKGAATSDTLVNFMTGLADVIPEIIDGLVTAGKGAFDFFMDMADALEPLIPSIEMIAGVLLKLASDALPEIARAIVAGTDAAVKFAIPLADIGIALLAFASPVIVALLTAIADALELIGDNVGIIEIGVGLWVAWEVAIGVAAFATTSFTAVALIPMIAALGLVVIQVGLALAALGALKAASAGASGDIGYLNEDVPIYEKPFQLAGRGAFALFGGDRGDTERADMFEAGRAAAESFNLSLLDNAEDFNDAREQALEYGASLGLTADQAVDFANVVALAWKEAGAAADQAEVDEFGIFGEPDAMRTWADFLAEATTAAEGYMRVLTGRTDQTFIDVPVIEEASDLIKLLENSAEAAADQVDALLNPSSGSTIDDFLRELPGLAEDLTESLRTAGSGILGNLERGGILGNVADQTRKVINTLVDDYGLSLEQIKALLDDRGLTAIIEALGDATQVAAQEVDPLIEKYGDLGYSVDVLDKAVDKLNDERKSNLETQIDAVTKALDAARDAAEEAKEALKNYFSGDTGGVQGAIDDLVLDIPDIGSDIEEALLKGGVQGEAGVRSAMSEIGSGLAEIFQLGLEQGLSPEQIIAMLGPVYGSIQQEVGGALGRIASLDWTDGFTPSAAAEIQDWLAGILDPDQISDLFGGIIGSDSVIAGLEQQLEDLNAQLDVEAVFSPEQVQAAIDELSPPDIMTEPVVTQEAAQAIFDEIQRVLDDDELALAVDQQNITNDIMNAAKDAEDAIQLDFDSRLVFDQEALTLMAEVVGGQFAEMFRRGLLETLSEPLPESAYTGLTPNGAVPGIGENPPMSFTTNVNVNGAQSPIATASEVVAASAAAASSGGMYRYGMLGTNPR